jgi:hypothetical protein
VLLAQRRSSPVGCPAFRGDSPRGSASYAGDSGSCGWYKKAGVTGEVILYKDNVTVRAIVARTGKVLSSKTFVGFVPTCDTSKIQNESPPWEIHGAPNSSDITAYELSLSE